MRGLGHSWFLLAVAACAGTESSPAVPPSPTPSAAPSAPPSRSPAAETRPTSRIRPQSASASYALTPPEPTASHAPDDLVSSAAADPCVTPLIPAGMPGCGSEAFACGDDCNQTCRSCVARCATDQACADSCVATHRRCFSGKCATRKQACEKAWAADKLRNFGCKRTPLSKACEELNACLYEHDPPADVAARRIPACAKMTGCSVSMAQKIWAGGGNVPASQLLLMIDGP